MIADDVDCYVRYLLEKESIVNEPEEAVAEEEAEEIVELAKSQIGKLTGDGPFASLIWADSEITYCDRFVSAVMTVASGKPLSERKSYDTAYDDYIAHKDLIKSGEPPEGAVVYYRKHKENWNCGHVGIFDGEGNIISVVNRTKGVDITPLNYFRAPLLGWVTFKEYKSQEEVVEEVINETWEEEAVEMVEEKELTEPLESPHPYANNYRNTWIISEPGVSQMRLHFKKVELGYSDYLRILDKNDQELVSWRYISEENWNRRTEEQKWTEWFTTDILKVELYTDSQGTAYGFIADKIETKR
ncbi:MAG: hypothetical protein L6408_08160 [Nanoarchaeota archaeon]|nr:hypothetical protein [Nanoarchaeota archaeon]